MRKTKMIVALALVVAALLTLAACSAGLSGTYQKDGDEKTYIEFKSGGKCEWHELGATFDGTYKKDGDGFEIKVKGSGFVPSAEFLAVAEGEDLRVTGGAYPEDGILFIKQ